MLVEGAEARFLPPKHVLSVFVPLAPMQRQIYKDFVESQRWTSIAEKVEKSGNAGTAKVLGSIMAVQKLCNHPCLLRNASGNQVQEGFEAAQPFFDELDAEDRAAGEGRTRGARKLRPELSAKMHLTLRLLQDVRATTTDKVVVISYSGMTLDLLEQLCRDQQWGCVRLDGSMAVARRHKVRRVAIVLTFGPNCSIRLDFSRGMFWRIVRDSLCGSFKFQQISTTTLTFITSCVVSGCPLNALPY